VCVCVCQFNDDRSHDDRNKASSRCSLHTKDTAQRSRCGVNQALSQIFWGNIMCPTARLQHNSVTWSEQVLVLTCYVGLSDIHSDTVWSKISFLRCGGASHCLCAVCCEWLLANTCDHSRDGVGCTALLRACLVVAVCCDVEFHAPRVSVDIRKVSWKAGCRLLWKCLQGWFRLTDWDAVGSW
jgi:hypothetical protein